MNVIKKTVSLFLIITITVSFAAVSAFAAGDEIIPVYETVSDNDACDISVSFPTTTLNDGKVWVNKAVSDTTIDMRDANGNTYQLTDAQREAASAGDEDFVVGMAALAQSFKQYTNEEERTDLNVVFVMDVSTSMEKAMAPFTSTNQTRLSVLQPAANIFIDQLAEIGEETNVNLAMISYMGSATTIFNWGQIGETNSTYAANTTAAHHAINNINKAPYKYSVSFTNSEAGLYLADYIYDTTNNVPKPDNIESENTKNFVIFMTDGGPNRWFQNPDNLTVSKNGDGFYRLTNSANELSPDITNTDYQYNAAVGALDQANQISDINNITMYTLGLSSWFTSEASESKFPTSVNFMKLCAAVGNKIIDVEEAKTYCGADIKNGAMPGGTAQWGGCPSFPEYDNRDFKKSSTATTWNISTRNASNQAITNTYSTLASFESAFEEIYGDLETRKTQGIYTIPASIDQKITNYYAGNTADKFNASFTDIAYHIILSMSDYVTSVEDSAAADISGYVHLSDEIGEYMEVKTMNGVIHNGVLYNGYEFARKFSTLDWLDEDSVTNDTFRRSLYDRCGIPSDKTTLRQVFSGAINGGSIYYNSATDYGCDLLWYADVERHFLGTYYAADGSVNPPPAGAAFRISSYMTWGSASVGDNAPDTEMFFLTVAVADALQSGRQIVIMDIPASLMPVRTVEAVFDESHKDGVAEVTFDALPICLLYTVGFKDNITDVRDDYQYTGIDDDGNTLYNFYSNQWNANLYYPGGHPAYASFAPSDENPFYYKTGNDSLIYTYNSGNGQYQKATGFDPDDTYYYYEEYYNDVGHQSAYIKLYNEYETLGENIDPYKYVYVGEDGFLYSKVGAPKISDLNYTQIPKTYFAEGNASESADFYKHFYYSLAAVTDIGRVVPYGTDVLIQLGNNGKLTLNTVETTITKEWNDGGNIMNQRPQSVTVDVYRDDVYYDTITISAENSTVSADGSTWEYRYTVPFGYAYTFTEQTVEGYTTSYSDDGYTITNTLKFDETVVLDYGIATSINLPTSIGGVAVTTSELITKNSDLSYGTVSLSASKKQVTYTPNTTGWNGFDTIAYRATLDNGSASKLTGLIYVMPATSVYYEENFLSLTNGREAGWTSVGANDATSLQDNSQINEYVYGYDPEYGDEAGDSNGGSVKTTVSATDKTYVWPTASFDFYGTMVEIFSRTASNTGLMTIRITNLDTGKTVDATPINTVYEGEGSLYQIPVYRCDIGTYGHYAVEIKAAYSSYFDTNKLGAYDVFIDAIRVFNPAGTGLTTGRIYDKYLEDNELNPIYGRMRDGLITEASGNLIQNGISGANGIMYVALNDKTTDISTYNSDGPNYEIYLKNGNAVAFNLSGYGEGDEVHISVKSPLGGGNKAVLTVNGNNVDYIDSATEQYYNITDYISDGTVVITNTGNGILSLVNYKIINAGDDGNLIQAVSNLETYVAASNVLTLQKLNAGSLELPEILSFDANVVYDGEKHGFKLDANSSSFTIENRNGLWTASSYAYINNKQLQQAIDDAGIPANYKTTFVRQEIKAVWNGSEWVTQTIDFNLIPSNVSGEQGTSPALTGLFDAIISIITMFFSRLFGMKS